MHVSREKPELFDNDIFVRAQLAGLFDNDSLGFNILESLLFLSALRAWFSHPPFASKNRDGRWGESNSSRGKALSVREATRRRSRRVTAVAFSCNLRVGRIDMRTGRLSKYYCSTYIIVSSLLEPFFIYYARTNSNKGWGGGGSIPQILCVFTGLLESLLRCTGRDVSVALPSNLSFG